MNICVVGLGYIGTVTGALLADAGHKIIGVDVNEDKINMLNLGKAPIIEPGLDEVISRVVKKESFYATNEIENAILNSDVAFICIGTPSKQNGDLDLTILIEEIKKIAGIVQKQKKPFPIFIRSTIKPGTVEKLSKELGTIYGDSKLLSINVNPEFLREGTAIQDFLNPPVTVVGLSEGENINIIENIYKFLGKDIIYTNIRAGEIIKYINNSFHALKVAFTNEVSSICQSQKIDSNQVMEIFKLDKILNISDYYLNPGFAYGGSCLPKDLRGLVKLSHECDLKVPILEAISISNSIQVQKLENILTNFSKCRIGFYGIAFKNDTDDLRESPIVEVIEYMIGKGYEIKIYDPDVKLSFISGGNLKYLQHHFSHFSELFEDNIEQFIRESDVIVFNKRVNLKYLDLISQKTVVDLHYQKGLVKIGKYVGFNW